MQPDPRRNLRPSGRGGCQGTKDLGDLAEVIAKEIPGATRAAEQNELVRSLVNPVSRGLAHTLAKKLGVPAPGFPSPEEEAKVSLAKQQERVKQLEELLSKV